MRVYHFYDPATGALKGRTYSGPPDSLAANVPPGLAAVEGHYDHLSQRVDTATGQVIDYQPPQPSQDHEWRADVKRWQVSGAAQAKAAAGVAARARIAALEAASGPLVRKAVLGDETARERLQEIEAEIAGLGPQLS